MSAGGIPTPPPLPTLRATMPPLPPHPAAQPPSAPGLSLESGGSAPLPGLRATIPPPAMPPAAGAPSPPAGAAAPGPNPPPIMMPAQPAGDPQAARRLAAAYRDAADALARTELTATWTLGTLGGLWSGPARDAADVPLDALARQARTLAAGLTETADQLETYARRLEDAQHDHAMSVAKLVTLGVVVGVTVGAVVVTMGAAAVVAAGTEAAVTAGAAAATEAAGAAAAAEAGAASGLVSCSGLLTGVRVFTAWALPHVVEAECNAGTTAFMDLSTTGQISARGTAEAAALGFVGSVGSSRALGSLAKSPWWAEASAVRQVVTTKSVETATNAGISAAQQLIDTGQVESGTTLRDTALSSGVGAARRRGAKTLVEHGPNGQPPTSDDLADSPPAATTGGQP